MPTCSTKIRKIRHHLRLPRGTRGRKYRTCWSRQGQEQITSTRRLVTRTWKVVARIVILQVVVLPLITRKKPRNAPLLKDNHSTASGEPSHTPWLSSKTASTRHLERTSWKNLRITILRLPSIGWIKRTCRSSSSQRTLRTFHMIHGIVSPSCWWASCGGRIVPRSFMNQSTRRSSTFLTTAKSSRSPLTLEQ